MVSTYADWLPHDCAGPGRPVVLGMNRADGSRLPTLLDGRASAMRRCAHMMLFHLGGDSLGVGSCRGRGHCARGRGQDSDQEDR